MTAIIQSTPSNFILNWFKDETFYSICSRQHYYLGNLDSASTFNWLFGRPKAHTHHDFPINLGLLNPEAIATWGSPTSIILNHSIVPFFFPFQSRPQVEEALEVLKSSSLGSLKYRLGLVTGRFGAEHPLKACTECIISDREVHGVAYWHLSHQYPGVILCPEHHSRLRLSIKNRQWSGRFQWLLPDNAVLAPDTGMGISSNDQRRLLDLAKAILELATYGLEKTFESVIVAEIYRDVLGNLGAHQPGLESLEESLARYTSQLQLYPPLTVLPITRAGATALLKQLTRSPRGHCHPLKHLAVITWLFGALTPFVDEYDRLQNRSTSCAHRPSPVESVKSKVSVMSTAPASNEIIKRRPKVLKEKIRSSILDRLKKGEDKASTCAEFGITISTLNKLLRSEPKIRQQWLKNYKASLKSQHRSLWLITVKAFQSPGAKQIRTIIPKVYIWLYRNDKQWLERHTKALSSKRSGNHSKIDWDKRDSDLLSSIVSALKIKAGNQPDTLVGKSRLNTLFPNLSKALEAKNHYPLTRALVRKITGKSKALVV